MACGSTPASRSASGSRATATRPSNECWTVGYNNTVNELTGRPPCCAYCCPANFTEQFYADRPDKYAEHPPTFLVQHRNVDENADACAALNYHQTMVAHGGRSEIHMIEPDEARCFCIGRGNRRWCPGPRPRPGVPLWHAAPA